MVHRRRQAPCSAQQSTRLVCSQELLTQHSDVIFGLHMRVTMGGETPCISISVASCATAVGSTCTNMRIFPSSFITRSELTSVRTHCTLYVAAVKGIYYSGHVSIAELSSDHYRIDVHVAIQNPVFRVERWIIECEHLGPALCCRNKYLSTLSIKSARLLPCSIRQSSRRKMFSRMKPLHARLPAHSRRCQPSHLREESTT